MILFIENHYFAIVFDSGVDRVNALLYVFILCFRSVGGEYVRAFKAFGFILTAQAPQNVDQIPA